MVRTGLLVFILIICAGCNLSSAGVPTPTADLPIATEDVALKPTRTPISFGATVRPTLLPLIDPGIVTISTAHPTLIPVTSFPALGGLCQVYTTYSGVDPRNSLSLRTSASTSAPQVFRVPNNQQVLLVPGSGEVEADGYQATTFEGAPSDFNGEFQRVVLTRTVVGQ